MIHQPGADETARQRIAGGRLAIVYLWLTLRDDAAAPTMLSHVLEAKVDGYTETTVAETRPTPVSSGPVPLLSPPVRGGPWVIGDGPDNAASHRRAVIALDAHGTSAQRFAGDWTKLDESGRARSGKARTNAQHPAHGEPVLAVAAGTIVAAVDGISDNDPSVARRAVPITLSTIAGNYVSLDLGSGLFALYAHLKRGSVRVRVGDRVRPGDVLGQIGNSGNTTGPHLHFHVSTSASPLGGEGVPYEFEAYSRWPRSAPGTLDLLRAPERVKKECPLGNEVVSF
jgi:hypothetical protein